MFSPATRLLLRARPLLCGASRDTGAANDEVLKELRPEFEQLRLMIRRDTEELLNAELKKLSLGTAENAVAQSAASGDLRSNGKGNLLVPPAPCFSRQVSRQSAASGDLRSNGKGNLLLPPAPCFTRQVSRQILRQVSQDLEAAPLMQAGEHFEGRHRFGSFQRQLSESFQRQSSGSFKRQLSGMPCQQLQSIKTRIRESREKYAERGKFQRFIQQVRSVCPEVRWLNGLLDGFEWLLQLEEPAREGCLASFEFSKAFQTLFTLVLLAFQTFFTLLVLANAVFMVFEVNHSVLHPLDGPTSDMKSIDHIFLALYSFELIVKLCVHRLYFFWNADMQWNILDFGLVCYSFSELALSLTAGDNPSGQKTWMRSLRVFKMAKVLRILRVVKAFKQLQLILGCLVGSLMAMLWSLVMIFIMNYMFALALLQQASIYLGDNKDSDHSGMLLYFGSVEGCMWILFKTTFGADWEDLYEEISKLGIMAQVVWVSFIVLTQIALLNILTGIFVENALEIAAGNTEEKAIKHEEQLMEDAIELRKLCEEWDANCSTSLSREEFERMLRSEEFARHLLFIGLDTTHMEMLFDVISTDNQEEVDIDTFVAGCMQLRGSAKSSELIALVMEVKNMEKMHTKSSRELMEQLGSLQKSMERSRALGG